MADDEEGGSGLGFTLPPIRLPTTLFPEGLRLQIPAWASGKGNRLLAAFVLDLGDAAVVILIGDSMVRAFIGTAVMALLHGPYGLVYAVESLPTLANLSFIAVIPTATILTYTLQQTIR